MRDAPQVRFSVFHAPDQVTDLYTDFRSLWVRTESTCESASSCPLQSSPVRNLAQSERRRNVLCQQFTPRANVFAPEPVAAAWTRTSGPFRARMRALKRSPPTPNRYASEWHGPAMEQRRPRMFFRDCRQFRSCRAPPITTRPNKLPHGWRQLLCTEVVENDWLRQFGEFRLLSRGSLVRVQPRLPFGFVRTDFLWGFEQPIPSPQGNTRIDHRSSRNTALVLPTAR
jgi:hypothetical protein